MTTAGTRGLGGRWRAVAVPYTALRLGGQAAEFLGWVILARRLGATAFGELSIAFLACRYAGIVADWGATMRGPRDVAADGRQGSVRVYVRTRTALALGLAAVAAGTLVLLDRPELVPVTAVVLALGLSRDWIALGREAGARAAAPIAVQGALLALASWGFPDVAGGAAAVAAGYGAAAVLSIALNRVPHDLGRGARRIDAWMLAAVLAIQVTSSLDTVLLGWLASTSDAGVYAAVYRIPNAWIALLSALLAGLLPLATRTLHQDGERFGRLRVRSLRVSAKAAGAVVLFAPVGALLVPVVFGPDYRDGRLPALLLLLATAVITLAAPLHPLAVSAGRDRAYALVMVGGAAGNIALNLVLIPPFGMVGAAAATLAAQLGVSWLLWRLVQQQAAGLRAA